mmetsp:Transcript_6449/g.17243  ORF Transcript_6449/g.17243 Transcript_6449/m.17243 type:complete len:82 (-) Transcript_6449:7104-7349(-)
MVYRYSLGLMYRAVQAPESLSKFLLDSKQPRKKGQRWALAHLHLQQDTSMCAHARARTHTLTYTRTGAQTGAYKVFTTEFA